MKYKAGEILVLGLRRPPRGGRGLKYALKTGWRPIPHWSPPSRGAWIEMGKDCEVERWKESPPSRGAWIEIPLRGMAGYGGDVAPLAGGVD